MQKYLSLKIICKLRMHRQRLIIAASWVIGLLIGFLTALYAPWSFVSLTTITNGGCTPANVLPVKLLTFVLGCLACLYSYRLLYVFLFLRGFLYAMVSVNLLCVSVQAGWLLQLMLLSTDTILIFLILLFALRNIGQGRCALYKNTALCVIASASVIIFESYFLIPFTNLLLNS